MFIDNVINLFSTNFFSLAKQHLLVLTTAWFNCFIVVGYCLGKDHHETSEVDRRLDIGRFCSDPTQISRKHRQTDRQTFKHLTNFQSCSLISCWHSRCLQDHIWQRWHTQVNTLPADAAEADRNPFSAFFFLGLKNDVNDTWTNHFVKSFGIKNRK